MITYVVALEILVIGFVFTAMVFLLAGEGSKEQKLMEYFLCGSLVQNVGCLLEMTAANLEAAVMAVKVEYLGCAFIPLCYCWFLYSYCYEKAPRKFLKLLGIINFAMLLVVFTCDRHTVFYREMGWRQTSSGHGYLWLEYGSLYFLFLLCWMIIPYVLSIYVLIHAVITRTDQKENRQYRNILMVSILPILTYVAYALKWIRVVDPTPMTLGMGLSLVTILVWIRRNYDFRHLAADSVLDGMQDGVVALDDRKRLVSYNKAANEIFRQLKHYRTGERIGEKEPFWEELLDEGIARTFQLDGRYYESHTKQIVDENGKSQGYVILVLDITETRNYIDEIIEVRQQAEQANIAKSEFLANMSHEIRTPMNAIIGLSDIIMEECYGRKVYDYAQDVQSAAKNLLAIINDILDLSKVEAGKMELILSDYHIRTLVGEIVSMMDIAASQRGILMKYEYDTSIPCMYYGDEGRIKQILINLLNNAVKFTREGFVKISVGGRPGEQEGEELLVFRVEDTGCGIKEEDQEKIFEDFKQVDSKRNRTVEGTGLGLSITKHLVQLMEGKIELESVYGKGSTFIVTIPQQIVDARSLEEMPGETSKEPVSLDEFAAPDMKVLVVDDNTVNRKVANGFLSSYGMELSEASSGPEAIEMVKQTKYDFIFMDHMMPGMDGVEAVEHIREECGENGACPVIIALTANAMQGVREAFLDCGFQDYLSKPLSRKDLNELLKRWIPLERRVLKTREGMHEQKDSTGPVSYEAVSEETGQKPVARELQEALEDLERLKARRCTEKIEHVLKQGTEPGLEEKLEEILELLGEYEDDEAEEKLRRLLDNLSP